MYHFVVKQLKTKTHTEQPQIQDSMDISQPDVAAAGSVVVANALHLGEQGVGSEVYLQTHTKLLSAFGHLVGLPSPEVRRNATASMDALERFHQHIGCEKCVYPQRLPKKREWFFFEFGTLDLAKELFDYLSGMCDVVAIGTTVLGVCMAICHRRSYGVLQIERFRPGAFFTPKLHRKKNSNDLAFKFVDAWLQAQQDVMMNFFVLSPTEYTDEHIIDEWEGRTRAHVLRDIHSCKSTSKSQRTARQSYVADDNNATLLAIWAAEASETKQTYIIQISDNDILDINIFIPKPSEIMFLYVDVSDGSIHQFSVRDWIYEKHATHTAVLHGGPKLGKTPLAKSMAACVAQLSADDGGELHFLQVSTLDILSRRLSQGVPILLDEFNPSVQRGSRQAHNCEDLKIITDIVEGGTLNGRGGAQGGDIHFPNMVPRIITCNAGSPFEFFRELPDNVFTTMTNEARMALSNDAKAILKRCAFFHIQQAVVPESVVESYAAERRAALKRRASEVFSGARAIG